MDRPKGWDEKYGPWGTPPDYTPPMTTTNNIQSPTGLRVGGVVSAIFAVVGIMLWWFLSITEEPVTLKMGFCLSLIIGLGSYMTWWCFYLASRRSKWLREKAFKESQNRNHQ